MPSRASSRFAKMYATLVSEPPPLFRSACSPSASLMLNSMGVILHVEVLAPMPDAADVEAPRVGASPSGPSRQPTWTAVGGARCATCPRLDVLHVDASGVFAQFFSLS